MSQIQIRKAERVKSKLRLAIAGPAGGGKTMGALKLAQGIGGRVCLIDTERGSGDLYADLYDYDIISLEPPYKPDTMIAAIGAAEAAGYDVIIIDSLSHFWSDEGGLLDQVDKMKSAGKNSYTLWADITPQHRRLVNAMLNSTKHIIATMRSKQAYELEKDEKTGKNTVKKLGLQPVQREGMEYEFTIFFDVDQSHYTKASKDRTNMFKDEVFILDESIGKRVLTWLNTGVSDVRGLRRDVFSQIKDRLEIPLPDKEDLPDFMRHAIKQLTGLEWTEENLEKILEKLVQITDKEEAKKKAWGPAPKEPVAPPTPPEASETPPAPEVVQEPKPEENVPPTPQTESEAPAPEPKADPITKTKPWKQ